MAFIWTVFFHS